ncbi:hypothetical protein QT327_21370 [Olivibacter sp. 47]|uniref:hypothetical protein n=1 Tax=Olivibacter sp. 47 TaxID=3056486 RepID=UPI0025A48684|nr:hypothetical protein [Olivibacter sp. 47]MDM8176867.1 hypothetical protein [Olivibacter sp. 47]
MENKTKVIGYVDGAEAYELTKKEKLMIWGLVLLSLAVLVSTILFWETVSNSVKIGIALCLIAFIDVLAAIKRARNAKK